MEENPLLSMLKDNVVKWNNIVDAIEIESSKLKSGEDIAYRKLRDHWKYNNFNAAECNALLTEMQKYKAKHVKDKFLENLQEFRALCKGYYTKDKGTFEAFQKALGGKQSRPMPSKSVPAPPKPASPKPITPQPKPVPPTPVPPSPTDDWWQQFGKPKKSWSLFPPSYKYKVSHAINNFFDTSYKAHLIAKWVIPVILLISICIKSFILALVLGFIVFLIRKKDAFFDYLAISGLWIIKWWILIHSYIIEWFCLIRWQYKIGIVIAGLISYFMLSDIDVSNFFQSNNKPKIEITQPVANYYYSTANTLYVRDRPNGKIIGKLKKYETVNIYEIENNCGKIRYNGITGYVNMKYLVKVGKP